MKKLLFYTLFIFMPISVGLLYLLPKNSAKIEKFLTYNQCDTPTKYKIGNIDPQFKLTETQIKNFISDSIKLLKYGSNKELFIFSPEALLTVNFIYDERTKLHEEISKDQANVESESKTLNEQIADYEARYKALKNETDIFNATVDKYNTEGGAPPKAYEELVKKQNYLKNESTKLSAISKNLNLESDNYNEKIGNLNENITDFNNKLKDKPEEGLYDPNNNTITIYYAINQNELVHTLAHEFGHALGMSHSADENSLMYPYSTEITTLTPEDIAQVAYICRDQSILTFIKNRIQTNFSYFRTFFPSIKIV